MDLLDTLPRQRFNSDFTIQENAEPDVFMPRLRTYLIPLCFFVLASCSTDRGPEIEFGLVAGRVPRRWRDSVAGDRAPEDTVRFRLPGTVYDPPEVMPIVSRDSAHRFTPLAASAAAYSAFKAADDQWILASFALADRDEIASFLADSNVRRENRAMFERIEQMKVYGVAEHVVDSTEYRLVFFSYYDDPERGNLHTYVLEYGEWKRTNALSRDPTASLAAAGFRRGRMRQN